MLPLERLRLLSLLATAAALPRQQRDPRVARRLGQLRGLPQKVAHLLALRHLGRRHPEAAHFAPLLRSGQPLPDHDLLQQLRDDLGHRASGLHLHLPPLAAASTAQVYAAKAPDHSPHPLVVKLLLPRAADTLQRDLALIHRLSAALRPLLPEDLRALPRIVADAIDALAPALLSELDLALEAQRLLQLQPWLHAHHPGLTCPTPLLHLSSTRVLTMTRAHGPDLLTALEDASPDQRRSALQRLLRVWLHALFELRLVWTDPHPANVSAAGKPPNSLELLTILDTAAFHPAPDGLPEHLHTLLHCARRRAPPPPALMEVIAPGWGPASDDARAALNHALLRPLADDAPFDPATHHLADQLRDLRRQAPGMPPLAAPPQLLLLLRALSFLMALLRRYNVKLPWFPLLPDAIQRPPAGDARPCS